MPSTAPPSGPVEGDESSDFAVRARVVVNATGVWADEVRALDEGADPHAIRPAKGVHVTVPADRLPCDIAAVIPVPKDKRSIFVVSWPGTDLVYLGTTDTDYRGPLDDPACTPEDVDYLLEAANNVTTSHLTRADVTGRVGGPAPAAGRRRRRAGTSRNARRTSRAATPSATSAHGVVTVTGGKLTTYRKMAQDTVDAVVGRLGESPRRRRCVTKSLPLIGATTKTRDPVAMAQPQRATARPLRDRVQGRARPGRRPPRAARTRWWPGCPTPAPSWCTPPARRWRCTLDDVLSRRTRASIQRAHAAMAAATAAAALIAPDMGWDEKGADGPGGPVRRVLPEGAPDGGARPADDGAHAASPRSTPPGPRSGTDSAPRRSRCPPAAPRPHRGQRRRPCSPTTSPGPRRGATGGRSPSAGPPRVRVPQRPAAVVRPASTDAGGRGAGGLQRGRRAGHRRGRAQRRVRRLDPRPRRGGPRHDRRSRACVGVDETSLTADVRAGTFGPDLEAALGKVGGGYTLGHWPQSMDLSTVGGWLACRGAGPVLDPLREDRGHGHRPRGRAGRRPHRPHRGAGPAGRHRAEPDPALRRQRGHPRRHHRGPASHPPAPRRARSAAPSASRPSPTGLEACRRILRRGATPAVLRLYDETESGRNFDQPDTNVLIVLDEADPDILSGTLAVVDAECGPRSGAQPLDRRPGRALARAPQRRLRARPAVARRHRRRHRRDLGAVGRAARALRRGRRRAHGRSRARSPRRPTSPTPTPTAPASTSPSAGAGPKATPSGASATTGRRGMPSPTPPWPTAPPSATTTASG